LRDLTSLRQKLQAEKESELSIAAAQATRLKCIPLAAFVREAWPHIPELADKPYVEGWHIDFICAHLEAITTGAFLKHGYQNRVLINVPPGTTKSLLVAVFWPAWEWTRDPSVQYIITSYKEDYCKRDTGRMRDLVCSPWYQMLWGKQRTVPNGRIIKGVEMVAVGERMISNTAGGWRKGVPFGSLTGERADRVILDDPHSVDTAESDAQRHRTAMRFRESVPSRINDPVESAIVVIMQRLHVHDVSGVIEQLKMPYVHVRLPMEFEVDRRCVTPLGRDPRKQQGELLFPKRFPREVVERDKVPLGPNGIAGQYQQRPYLRGGAMFKQAWFTTVSAAPNGTRWVRHWDLAASKRKSAGAYGQAWTAGVKIGRGPGEHGDYYVGHVFRLQDEGDEVRKAIKMIASIDGPEVAISLPQDPGQAGKVQARDMIRMLAGWVVRAQSETGDKITRAEPFQAQCAAGNVKIIKTNDPAKDGWMQAYVDELLAFPGSATKDQVDATSGAFAALQLIGMDHRNGDVGTASPRADAGGYTNFDNGIDDLGTPPRQAEGSLGEDFMAGADFGDATRGSLF
jgi:predicted phage terminase large subunit-like protein